jgi:hypothetical protein
MIVRKRKNGKHFNTNTQALLFLNLSIMAVPEVSKKDTITSNNSCRKPALSKV